jgi:hypothetical protein
MSNEEHTNRFESKPHFFTEAGAITQSGARTFGKKNVNRLRSEGRILFQESPIKNADLKPAILTIELFTFIFNRFKSIKLFYPLILNYFNKPGCAI